MVSFYFPPYYSSKQREAYELSNITWKRQQCESREIASGTLVTHSRQKASRKQQRRSGRSYRANGAHLTFLLAR